MRKTELEAGAGALAEYYGWFEGARVGDVLVYHKGDLAFDSDPESHPGLDQDALELVKAVGKLALRVRIDAGTGHLLLTQKKLGPSLYEYRAVRKLSPLERRQTDTSTDANLVHA